VVSNFIVQALSGQSLTIYGQGEQTRSFTFVDDLIDGIWRLLMHDDTGPSGATDPSAADASAANPLPADPDAKDIHQPVNIGNPVEFTVAQLANLVLEFTGGQSQIEHRPLPLDDPKVRQPDITRARALLGFEPRVPLEQGLQNTIPYFREQVQGGA
jgi:dTDP-glucose 4,6-dehydratase